VSARRVPRVLVVEDDTVIAASMGAHLRHAGLAVETIVDGARALRKVRFDRPDVLVLDLMIPGTDGWEILREMRTDGIECPVLVVSARASEEDKVRVLGMGADDYLAKPFGMGELVARVEAALRRSRVVDPAGTAERIEAPGLVIDPDLHAVLVDGVDAGLTPLEFRLLAALASERGRVVTRDRLRQRVWGVPHSKRDRSVDVCVRKLRAKVDLQSSGYTYLHTHPGVGYRFEPVARAADAAAS
jgi:DNA-binding response OmpR family regulator